MNKQPYENRKRRRAAALIELALILPLLITLVLICIDFGRFATVHIALTNAAREGANFGGMHNSSDATHHTWRQGVVDAVTAEMSGIPGYSASQLNVEDPIVFASNSRSRVRVEVSYRFEPAINWPLIPNEVEMSHTAEMPAIR